MLKNSNLQPIRQETWRANRSTGLLLISLGYLVALVVGVMVYNSVAQSIWLNLFWADLAATILIWIFSLILDNASFYDPYWSVQPVIILPLLVLQVGKLNLTSILLCVVVVLWGVRLTLNWISTFHGLHEQDWRYDQIKDRTGIFYPIVNLVGIQLMPTLVVLACIAPAVFVIVRTHGFSPLILPGLFVSLLGLSLEAIADHQMSDFRKNHPDRMAIIREGLWKYSRHPNYLGEILMWWGVYLVCLAVDPSAWMLGLGAFLNTSLFWFISIPMAEKRLAEYKEGFFEYQQQTRRLLLIPKRTR